MSQGFTPSMDHEILNLFSDLKYDILRIVKKHFTRPMNVELKALESAPWKDYHPLSRENRQLWIQAFIADDLFEQFFSGKRKLFGFDAEQEQVLQDIESTLTKSGRGQTPFQSLLELSQTFYCSERSRHRRLACPYSLLWTKTRPRDSHRPHPQPSPRHSPRSRTYRSTKFQRGEGGRKSHDINLRPSFRSRDPVPQQQGVLFMVAKQITI